jgi:hypothetical protein
MDISGRGSGGKAQARRLAHERPSELQRSTSWVVAPKLKGCLRVMNILWDRATSMRVRREDGQAGAMLCCAPTAVQLPTLQGPVTNVRSDELLTSRDVRREGDDRVADAGCRLQVAGC